MTAKLEGEPTGVDDRLRSDLDVLEVPNENPAKFDPDVPPVALDALAGPLALSMAAANVIMQLSQLPIGHGVAKSTVETGRADLHPVKRLRTTLSYVAVALLGSDSERDVMRREVNRSHAAVRSGPTDEVQYSAFDPELQLWVAACIYRGLEQTYELQYGTLDDEAADVLYRHSARIATTLQVKEDLWPADRAAFEEYWHASVETIEMDDLTRSYLVSLATLGELPTLVRLVFGPVQQFLTTGYLPEPFRSELGLPWGPNRERAFAVATRTLGWGVARLPAPLRLFPFNAYHGDARRRIRAGQPIV